MKFSDVNFIHLFVGGQDGLYVRTCYFKVLREVKHERGFVKNKSGQVTP